LLSSRGGEGRATGVCSLELVSISVSQKKQHDLRPTPTSAGLLRVLGGEEPRPRYLGPYGNGRVDWLKTDRKEIQERSVVAKTKTELREWISSGFTRVEDVTYVGLGLVLAVSVLVLLVIVALSLGQAIMSANLPQKIVRLLDQSLLILMIVEILYTVQVSFREHTLVAEPFLIVGLIAAIRRVLILTAEFSKPAEISEVAFHNVMFELGLLTVLILALVFSLFLLKRQLIASADRA